MSRKRLAIAAVVVFGCVGAALPALACNWYCDGCECKFSQTTTNMYCNTQWGCCFEEPAGSCFASGEDPDGLGLLGGTQTGDEAALACAVDADPAAAAPVADAGSGGSS